MAKRLDGKRVLITGASRGIGAAIAIAAAADGARVLLAARKLPGLDAVAEHIRASMQEALEHYDRAQIDTRDIPLGLPDDLLADLDRIERGTPASRARAARKKAA